ncbi:hypothetical protein MMC30_005773 [Trapelia coarctata]|nr:hypothetical protein [Trapelia coarctata]
MSAIAAASSVANGGGLGSPTKEDTRWGYVRADDDDSNSAFVFSQTHQHTASQSSAQNTGYEDYPKDGNSSLWYHNHGIAVSDDLTLRNHSPPKLLPSADISERSSGKLEAPRPKLGDLSRNGSETDSLLDLYRQQKAGFPATHNGISNGELPPGIMDPEEIDRERWIHRDKLAIIESQEARAAGIKIPQEYDVNPYHAGQSADPYTSHSREHEQRANSRQQHEGKRQRMQSRSPTRVESPEAQVFDDPRTPDEIAAELEEAGSPYFQHGLRASSSRIPLATASPVPVPQTHLERNTPLPRKRGTSGNYDEETLMYHKSRSRSHSVGSQVLLDDPDLQTEEQMPAYSEAFSSSPKKASMPSKSQPISGARGSSNTTNTARTTSATQKLRSPSTNAKGSPAQRPPTRSGPEGRPSTATNRPEGDPPWLATMYKPDPRLPPDQQIIPTHARRLQQEQWEKEGKPANVFGRDFTPLSVNTDEPPPPPPVEHDQEPTSGNRSPHPPEDTSAWPLKSPTSPAETGSVRSARLALGGAAAGNAGYSTIPRVQNSPAIGVRQSPQLPAPMEVHEPVKQEKEAGCACCIVM